MDEPQPDENGEQAPMPGLEELKDMIAHTLESKGVLGQIRAHLRAAVFTALDEQEHGSGVHLQHERALKLQSSEDGLTALALIKEFLDFHECDHTLNVLAAEASLDDVIPGRAQLRHDVGLPGVGSGIVPDRPVLVELLAALREKKERRTAPSPPVDREPRLVPLPEAHTGPWKKDHTSPPASRKSPSAAETTPESSSPPAADVSVEDGESFYSETESVEEEIPSPRPAPPAAVPPLGALPAHSSSALARQPLPPVASRGAALPPLQRGAAAPIPGADVESDSDVEFGSEDGDIEDILDETMSPVPAASRPALAPLSTTTQATLPAGHTDVPSAPLEIGDGRFLVVEDVETV